MVCFNLAIEMLVISGEKSSGRERRDAVKFQSRNRDACHFRRWHVIGRCCACLWFQSRNRDSCHFRLKMTLEDWRSFPEFQSRNRDSCHFRSVSARTFASKPHWVSISQSRFLSFQASERQVWRARGGVVSISQSRFLSFQVAQNCERDESACVSISQSRFLSFQVYGECITLKADVGFNLAIEILVISGRAFRIFIARAFHRFQSRNRDSCHFRLYASRFV